MKVVAGRVRCPLGDPTDGYCPFTPFNSVVFMRSLLDDEKFLFKHELKPEQTHEFALKNAKDIIAVGFKLEKTFIFSDYDYVGGPFYKNVSKISRQITLSQAKATFGFGDSCVPPHLLGCNTSLRPRFPFSAATTLARYTLLRSKPRRHFPTPSHKYLARHLTSHVSSHARSTKIPISASRATWRRN
jgi:hypothetical protein